MAKISGKRNRRRESVPIHRNSGACEKHRRLHEKCPLNCQGRLGQKIEMKKRGKKPKNRSYIPNFGYLTNMRIENLFTEELDFTIFCTTIGSLIKKYPTLYNNGDLSLEDCVNEMYLPD